MHGRSGKSITLSHSRHEKITLLRNSSLQGTEQTHYVIVHAKVVLEMINTKSESKQDLKLLEG